MSEQRDKYFVAFKVLLRDKNLLLITHDIFGDWDIPGGRIRESEFETPVAGVIARKMKEELGEEVKYELQEPKVFFRHERFENSTQENVRIFAVGYEAAYLSGTIQLGDHHDAYKWVDLNDFEPSDYFVGGWLRGVEEYKQLEVRV